MVTFAVLSPKLRTLSILLGITAAFLLISLGLTAKLLNDLVSVKNAINESSSGGGGKYSGKSVTLDYITKVYTSAKWITTTRSGAYSTYTTLDYSYFYSPYRTSTVVDAQDADYYSSYFSVQSATLSASFYQPTAGFKKRDPEHSTFLPAPTPTAPPVVIAQKPDPRPQLIPTLSPSLHARTGSLQNLERRRKGGSGIKFGGGSSSASSSSLDLEQIVDRSIIILAIDLVGILIVLAACVYGAVFIPRNLDKEERAADLRKCVSIVYSLLTFGTLIFFVLSVTFVIFFSIYLFLFFRDPLNNSFFAFFVINFILLVVILILSRRLIFGLRNLVRDDAAIEDEDVVDSTPNKEASSTDGQNAGVGGVGGHSAYDTYPASSSPSYQMLHEPYHKPQSTALYQQQPTSTPPSMPVPQANQAQTEPQHQPLTQLQSQQNVDYYRQQAASPPYQAAPSPPPLSSAVPPVKALPTLPVPPATTATAPISAPAGTENTKPPTGPDSNVLYRAVPDGTGGYRFEPVPST